MADKKIEKARPKNKVTGKQKSKTTTGLNKPNDMTNWRKELQQARVKFDDVQKQKYLIHLRKHGLKNAAAHSAGVAATTVSNHAENDPDFKESMAEALEEYNDSISSEVTRRGRDGYSEAIFYKGERVIEPILDEVTGVHLEDDEGKPRYRYTKIIKYSDRLLEMNAKRVNPGFRDHRTVDLNTPGGGLLVVPDGATAEDFIKEADEKNKEADKFHKARMEEIKQSIDDETGD